MITRQSISSAILGAIPAKDHEGKEMSAKAFLEKMEENFNSSSKIYEDASSQYHDHM
jgi:hypothetical protein